MSCKLSYVIADDGARIRLYEETLLGRVRTKAFESWSRHVSEPAVRALCTLIETDGARVEDDALFLSHALVATLSAGLAYHLGLPPLGWPILRKAGTARLKELKAMLDQPKGDLPAPMLRRLKDRARDGLPEKRVHAYRAEMPTAQADAYRKIVAEARVSQGARGKMLEILHRMRGISLHPERAAVDTSDACAVEAWINGSARLKQGVQALQEIRRKNEKALVFIEDLLVQETFAESAAVILRQERCFHPYPDGDPSRVWGSIFRREAS